MEIFFEQISFIISVLHGFAPVQIIKMKIESQSGFVLRGISQECYFVLFRKREIDNLKASEKASILSDGRVKK